MKLVQNCNYVNRLLKDGLDKNLDFNMNQIDKEQGDVTAETCIQVNCSELEQFANEHNEEYQEKRRSTQLSRGFIEALKDHIVTLASRNDEN